MQTTPTRKYWPVLTAIPRFRTSDNQSIVASELSARARPVGWVTPALAEHPLGADPRFLPESLTDPMPDLAQRLLNREDLQIEHFSPIHRGRLHDYPWSELRPAIERRLQPAAVSGPVWGSGMPEVERNCTYRQSSEY